MQVRELLTTWGFKVEHEKLDRVEAQLTAIKRRMDAFIAVDVTMKLARMVESFSKMGQELLLASESAGISVEAMQKLNYAAANAGVSAEEMQLSMFRLSRSLYQARKGGQEAQLAFSRLGLTPDQVRGFRTSQDALYGVADRIRSIHDPIERAALAQQLLGRGSRNMVGFLAQGSKALRGMGDEAERVGAVLSKGQVEALSKAYQAILRLTNVIKATAGAIAAELSPALQLAVNDLLKFWQANRAIIETNVEHWLYGFAYAMGFCWAGIKYGIGLLRELGRVLHIEDHVFALVGGLAMAGGGFLVLGQIVKWTRMLIWDAATAFDFLWASIGYGKAALVFLRMMFAELAFKWLPALIGEEGALAAVTMILEAPLYLIAAAVGAVILAVQALWTLLTGGDFKDTWLAKIGGAVGSVLSAFGGLFGLNGPAPGVGAPIPGATPPGPGSTFIPPSPQAVHDAMNRPFDPNVQISVPISLTSLPHGATLQDVQRAAFQGVNQALDTSTLRATGRAFKHPGRT